MPLPPLDHRQRERHDLQRRMTQPEGIGGLAHRRHRSHAAPFVETSSDGATAAFHARELLQAGDGSHHTTAPPPPSEQPIA